MDNKNNHTDFLKGLPTEPPFKVPEAYFETFDERLMARVKQSSGNPKQKGKLLRMLRPVLWLAAGFVMIFLLVHYPLKMFLPDGSTETELAAVENSILNEWLYSSDFYYLSLEDTDIDILDDDVLFDFLSNELSEYEIYSAMYN